MMTLPERYNRFVEHPRYGRGPRFTGLNPETDFGGDTFIHWHSPKSCRIPKTAIEADLNKQAPAPVPVTHYYDVERKCKDCDQLFLFFAAEQKYWYEELGFGLDSDCVRCVHCRNKQNGIAKLRNEYEALFAKENRSPEETLCMAKCCTQLIRNQIFTNKSIQRVRMLLNQLVDKHAMVDDIQRLRLNLTELENKPESPG